MRTIKFRGKEIESGQWVYGFYTQGSFIGTDTTRHLIDSDMLYDVIENTVCQFTGLLDKNGIEIYEGDIVTFSNHLQGLSRVVYDYAGFYIENKVYSTLLRPMMNNHIRVVGNIHDNPELLKSNKPFER